MFVAWPDSNTVKAQRTLREIIVPDSLFVDIHSLSDFDDTYTCDICTDTYLCSVCTEIENALQCDIFSDISYKISIDKVDVADVNVVLAANILSSKHSLYFLNLMKNCLK